MKRLLLLLAFIPSLLPAQDFYCDMLADGKTWSFIRWPYGYTHRMGMRGDTIVNGQTCRKYGYVNTDGTFSCTAAFRQDGDKVYVKYHNRKDFSLAYDFGVSVGDTLEMKSDWARIVVTGKDVVTARGHEMRHISYKVIEYYDGIEWRPVEGNYGSSWIEGIGGSTGPMSDIPTPELTGNYDYLMDISLGDEVGVDEENHRQRGLADPEVLRIIESGVDEVDAAGLVGLEIILIGRKAVSTAAPENISHRGC